LIVKDDEDKDKEDEMASSSGDQDAAKKAAAAMFGFGGFGQPSKESSKAPGTPNVWS
jgi:hypothetical protein